MMSDVKAVVEVRWLLAAFPEAEMRADVVYFNGSAFPVTVLRPGGNGEYWAWGDEFATNV